MPFKSIEAAIYQNGIEAIYAYYQAEGDPVLFQFFELERPTAHILKDFKALVEKGVVLKDAIEVASGNTLLHAATQKPDAINARNPLVAYLVQQGCSVNAQNKNWETPIHCALKAGNFSAAILCFESTEVVDVTLIERTELKTYLHFSYMHIERDLNMVAFLIQKGCDVNATDSNGMPIWYDLLEYAKREPEPTKLSMMALLNAEGVDLGVPYAGQNILHVAVSLKLAWLVKELVVRAPQLQHQKNVEGKTPLMLSMQSLACIPRLMTIKAKETATKNFLDALEIIEPLLKEGDIVDYPPRVWCERAIKMGWTVYEVHFFTFVYCYFPDHLARIVALCQDTQTTPYLLPFCKSDWDLVGQCRNKGVVAVSGSEIQKQMEVQFRALGELEVRGVPGEIPGCFGTSVTIKPFKGYTILEQVAFFEQMQRGKGSYTANWRAFLNRESTLDPAIRAACRRFLGNAKKASGYKRVTENIALEDALRTLNLEAVIYKNIRVHLNRSWVRKVIEVFATLHDAFLPPLVVQALDTPDSFLAVTLKTALRREGDFEKRRWFSDLHILDQTRVRNFMGDLVLLEEVRPTLITVRDAANGYNSPRQVQSERDRSADDVPSISLVPGKLKKN